MDIQKDVLLADYTTFHIGGPGDEFVVASTIDELIQAVKHAKKKEIPYFILGTGANILIGDKGFRGLVIKNEANRFSVFSSQLSENGESVFQVTGELTTGKQNSEERKQRTENSIQFTVESGAVMSDLIGFTAKKGLSGFEHYAGIPSTVGGALWQNLHFLSPDRTGTMYIGNILVSAEIMTEEGEKKIVDREYFHFGYDTSILHSNKDIVLSATFELMEKDPEEIESVIDANLKWREEKHPHNAIHISAGSVFRKIEGHGAGRLIEQVGLKGHQIGGAQISERHANFIINTGDATAKDVMNLINLVKEKVRQQLGLEMQMEISVVGEF